MDLVYFFVKEKFMSIYNQTQEEVLEQLSTSMEGLSNENDRNNTD